MWFVAFMAAALIAALAFALLPAMSSVMAAGPPPAVNCDIASAEYGTSISCTGSGADAASIVWPDGTADSLDSSVHRPAFVGPGEITVVDDSGAVLASTPIEISPDIRLECDDGALKTVYQLEATDLRAEGWDYVYRDLGSGRQIGPGDPEHPAGAALDGIERIVLEETYSTGFCKVFSEAADDLGGDFEVTLDSPWEGVTSHPVPIIGPSSKTRWAGIQPAELTGSVTVNGITASERQGVYMSGCT